MKNIKPILILLVFMISLVLMITACGSQIETGDDGGTVSPKNFNVCCCASNLHSAIGATSESDCEGPCKRMDPANTYWKLIDSLDTWAEYNDRFDANVKACEEFAGL